MRDEKKKDHYSVGGSHVGLSRHSELQMGCDITSCGYLSYDDRGGPPMFRYKQEASPFTIKGWTTARSLPLPASLLLEDRRADIKCRQFDSLRSSDPFSKGQLNSQ